MCRKKNKSSQLKIFCLAAAVMVLFLALLPGGFELTISPVQGGKPLLCCAIKPGESFVLHYIHSVNESPIWETHTIDKKGIICLLEERFLAFSAGMGHWPGHGTLTVRGKYQVIENINKPIGPFVLRIAGEKSQHIIICRNIEVNLSRIAAGEAVRVAAGSISMLTRFRRHLFSPASSFGAPGDK